MDPLEEAVRLANREARSSLVERAVENMGGPAMPAAREASVAVEADMPGVTAETDAAAGTINRRITIDFKRLRAARIINPEGDRSRTMEEFRLIKRSILLKAFNSRRGGLPNGHLIMVASTRPGEGKTFSAVNLAMSIASERDNTVLLVDADLSRANVLRTLGIEMDKEDPHARRGLVDLLEDSSLDVSDVMLRTNVDKLTILPAGQSHSMSTELLASERMRQLIQDISQRYRDRIVIFDTPPVLATSEPTALAMHVGQIMFVIEASKTSRAAIQQALDLLSMCPDIALVLNKAPMQFGAAQFGSYYKSYGYYGKAPRKRAG